MLQCSKRHQYLLTILHSHANHYYSTCCNQKTAYRKPCIAPRSLMHFTFVNIANYPSLLSPAQKKRMEQYPKVVPSAIFTLTQPHERSHHDGLQGGGYLLAYQSSRRSFLGKYILSPGFTPKASYHMSMWGSAPLTRHSPRAWGSLFVRLRISFSVMLAAHTPE